MIPTLEQIAREVWAYHYRIPETAYWVTGLAAAAALLLTPMADEIVALPALALALGLLGIVRWKVAKWRCRFAMVVPRFQEGADAKGRAVEAQAMVVDHLRSHLSTSMRSMIRPLPVEIGPADDGFAARLQRQLKATYVLHGRIAARGDSWSVYPRVLEPASRSVTHWDRFTHDVTPSNPRFGPLVSSLRPAVGVRDEEFPLDFCRDLEAVIQGLAGMAMAAFGRHDKAVELLDRALHGAAGSTNHQIDSLRVNRALSLAELDRLDEGIEFLRERLQLPDPSPHLLRGLAHLLTHRSWEEGPSAEADRAEAQKLLRQALEDEADPQREMTLYNLVMLLPESSNEADAMLNGLLSRRSSYRRLWYVRRLAALRFWIRVQDAREAGDSEAVRRFGRQAAKWYSRTVRARPRVQFVGLRRHRPFLLLETFPRSPILYANAKDGHNAAGHRLRAKYFEWRFQRIRRRMLKLGDRHLRDGDWVRAYGHFDWASCVGRHDGVEHRALAFAACSCWKGGRREDGEAMWEEAAHQNPDCLLGRALFVAQLRNLGLDPAVPGDEPTDLDETMKLILRRFPGWAWHTDGEFISPEEYARLEDSAEAAAGGQVS